MAMISNDADRPGMKEKEILAYLQQRMRAKRIQAVLKTDALQSKTAIRNMNCTFCRKVIILGSPYVSFKSQDKVIYKGKSLRTERMHQTCLSRYTRLQ